MIPFVISKVGQAVHAADFGISEWQRLKQTYRIGDFVTPCCSRPAVPKTSSNGIPFFAHHTDECTTSPESEWHIACKDLVLRSLASLDVHATLEKPISWHSGRAMADIYFEHRARRIAIEIQHSYQSLDRYIQRQDDYRTGQVESYWLVYQPRFLTLTKSISKLRMRRDFNGKFPENGFFPFIPELPALLLEINGDSGIVFGGSPLKATLAEWLISVIGDSFRYVDGAWRIV